MYGWYAGSEVYFKIRIRQVLIWSCIYACVLMDVLVAQVFQPPTPGYDGGRRGDRGLSVYRKGGGHI